MRSCQNVADILLKKWLTLRIFHNRAGLFYTLISLKLRVFKSVTTFREPGKRRQYLGLELSSTAVIPAPSYSRYVGKFINNNRDIFMLSAVLQCVEMTLIFS
jgi:hypothetical protein